MAQTNSAQCNSPTPFSFNEEGWKAEVRMTQQIVVLAVLPTVLQGVVTVLCVGSMYALIQRDRKIRVSSIVLVLSLLALFASTTLYFVYTILSTGSSILTLLVYSAEGLWSLPLGQALEVPRANLFRNYGPAQACARTAALSINILVGDAIVCWRACVLWQGNRAVRGISTAFLLVTFGLGLVDIEHTCVPDRRGITSARDADTGFLYAFFSYGVAASALSFGTNLWATVLVGYKALVSRRFTKKHAIAGALGLQTERVLLLLVESGAFYCAVWAVVLVWQIGEYIIADASSSVDGFWVVYGEMIAGALVPVIALYPNVIVVVIALNKSQIERGFERGREDASAHEGALGGGGPGPGLGRLPLRTLTVTDVRQAEMGEIDSQAPT